MPQWLGGWEVIAILAVVLLLFGPSQLPKLAKMFGKAAKSLKDGMDGKLGDDEEEPKPKAKSDDAPEAPPAKKDGSGDDA